MFMKRVRFVSLLGVFLLGVSTGGVVLADEAFPVRADIPFEFSVGNTRLPAVKYVITEIGDKELLSRHDGERRVAVDSWPSTRSGREPGLLIGTVAGPCD
jgi:hypothetical protein